MRWKWLAHLSIRCEYRVGLTFTSMQQMHNDLCPPPHHLATPFSQVTLLLLRATTAHGGVISPLRSSLYCDAFRDILHLRNPKVYKTWYVFVNYSIAIYLFPFPLLEFDFRCRKKSNVITNEIDYQILCSFSKQTIFLWLFANFLTIAWKNLFYFAQTFAERFKEPLLRLLPANDLIQFTYHCTITVYNEIDQKTTNTFFFLWNFSNLDSSNYLILAKNKIFMIWE